MSWQSIKRTWGSSNTRLRQRRVSASVSNAPAPTAQHLAKLESHGGSIRRGYAAPPAQVGAANELRASRAANVPAAPYQVHEVRPVQRQDAFALTHERGTARQHVKRPASAPPGKGGIRLARPGTLEQGAEQHKTHGRVCLYDKDHEYLGPKVLRDWHRSVGSPPPTPDQYLRRGGGADLLHRTTLAQWLKRHPVAAEPEFVRGTSGIALDWTYNPPPQTIFRYLRDNGTIDFVTMRWGGLQNHVEWGRRGPLHEVTEWNRRPIDIPIAKWLPVFLEGIREYEEPYRFLAIRGSESLILEAANGLRDMASDCVPPLRKALETREPTTVAIALELMKLSLSVCPQVAEVWIHQLWQFAQIFNLFVRRKFTVNMGYNTRDYAAIRQLVSDVLITLEEHGGEVATSLIRRYCRVDPAVTDASHLRRLRKEQERGRHKPLQPFLLF